jgi:hypothetical protein
MKILLHCFTQRERGIELDNCLFCMERKHRHHSVENKSRAHGEPFCLWLPHTHYLAVVGKLLSWWCPHCQLHWTLLYSELKWWYCLSPKDLEVRVWRLPQWPSGTVTTKCKRNWLICRGPHFYGSIWLRLIKKLCGSQASHRWLLYQLPVFNYFTTNIYKANSGTNL